MTELHQTLEYNRLMSPPTSFEVVFEYPGSSIGRYEHVSMKFSRFPNPSLWAHQPALVESTLGNYPRRTADVRTS